MSRTGWVDLLGPRFFDPRHMAVPDRLLQHLLFEAWPIGRIRLLEEDEDQVAPGIRTWWAGTHHRSSLAVAVETPRGIFGFSDVVFYYQNLEQNRPLGIQESMEECRIAYQRLRETTDVFVSPYDPTTMARFSGRRVSVADDTHGRRGGEPR